MYKQKEEASQNKLKSKTIPEGQEHAPRLEPTTPIRLADRNHAHYPSRHCTILEKKDGSMTDFQHTQSDPHGSHRKMLHVLLTQLPPRCALTFFPAPEGQAVKRLRTPPSKVLKEQRYIIRKEVCVTSSDDSRVDRIACAGSPSLSRLFLRMVQWRDG